jgi:hypothetical protein
MAAANWSLTGLQLKLIKIGARVVCDAGAITCELAAEARHLIGYSDKAG